MGGLLGLFRLHHTVRLFLALMGDRRVSPWLKISAVSGFIYIFSPLDVVPDFITGIGLVDDIIVSLLIMQTFVELAPAAAVEAHCERLGIDVERVLVSAPRTVQDALELFTWAIERRGGIGKGRGRGGRAGRTARQENEPPPAPGTEEDEPAPYLRYSAHSKPEE